MVYYLVIGNTGALVNARRERDIEEIRIASGRSKRAVAQKAPTAWAGLSPRKRQRRRQ